MPLPEYKTGFDITDSVNKTMANLNNMDLQEVQKKNYLSEIASRELNTPSLVKERETQNALRILQTKELDKKLQNSSLEDTAKGLLWLKDNPEQGKAYNLFREEKIKEFQQSGGKVGMHPSMLPEEDLFYRVEDDPKLGKTVTRWDDAAFNKFVDNGLLATKLIQSPEEGKTFKVLQKNPKYDPTNPESGSKYEEVEMVIKNGSPTVLGKGVAVDPFAKEKRADDLLEETKRHNKELEKSGANAEARNNEMIRHNKAVELIMAKNAQTAKEKVQVTKEGKPPKVRKLVTAKDGTVLYQMETGPVRVAVTDPESGDMKLVVAGEGYQKEVTELGKPEDPIAAKIGKRLDEAGKKKESSGLTQDKIAQARAWVNEQIKTRPADKDKLVKEFETITGTKF